MKAKTTLKAGELVHSDLPESLVSEIIKEIKMDFGSAGAKPGNSWGRWLGNSWGQEAGNSWGWPY